MITEFDKALACRPIAVLMPEAGSARGNPYVNLLAAALESAGVAVASRGTARRAVLHVHWPEQFLASTSTLRTVLKAAAFLFKLSAHRTRGGAIVWTAHNDRPHDPRHRTWLVSLLLRLFMRRVDGVVHLSAAGQAAVVARYPELAARKHALVRHGDLAEAYERLAPRVHCLAALGLPPTAKVLLIFGRVRPYRGVLEALTDLANTLPTDTLVWISGSCSDAALSERIMAVADSDDQVHAELRFLTDDELLIRIGASRLVLQPFQEVLHSGAVHLALGLGRSVLAPSSATLRELRDVNPERLLLYESLSIQEVRTALSAEEPAGPADLGSWDRIAQAHADLYASVLTS